MPYNSITARGDASALIPEDVAKQIIEGVTAKSTVMQLFPHTQMSRAQRRLPVLSALPTAYFITGADLTSRDTGLKQTTNMAWANKYLNAEEMAVIVPVPESLLDDVDYDLWAQIRPRLEEAIAVALDDAVFFGTNKPATWDIEIVTAAANAGNSHVIDYTTDLDYAGSINAVMGLVEADGYDVNGFVIRPQVKSVLRGMRDKNNQFLYVAEASIAKDGTRIATLYGETAYVSRAGLAKFGTGAANYSAICGDWTQGILGVRQDITFKVLDQAIIQDNTGAIVYNLAQQDMVALRVVCRYGFAVANPINRQQQTDANRYPFAVLQQKAAGGE